MQIILISLMGLLFGLLITWLFELVLKTNKKLRNKYYKHHKILFGYHVHHSAFGLIFIVLSIILFLTNQKTSALFVFWVGVGIIILHTVSDGRFVFIEKQRL